jgi:hypothetical protein
MSSPRKLSLQRAIFKPTIWPKTHHFPIPNIITAKIIILQGCRNLILIVDDWINTIPCIWEGLIKDRWIGGPFSSRGWYFWETIFCHPPLFLSSSLHDYLKIKVLFIPWGKNIQLLKKTLDHRNLFGTKFIALATPFGIRKLTYTIMAESSEHFLTNICALQGLTTFLSTFLKQNESKKLQVSRLIFLFGDGS